MAVKCFLLECVNPDAEAAERRWRRADTGEMIENLGQAPPGAMWDAWWLGPDNSNAYRINGSGPRLVVVLPNGHHWTPGGSCANCTRRGEEHDCWCVHGEPPRLTVDKHPEPGRSTCQAGAGSIAAGSGDRAWHGFLTNGVLVG